MTEAVIFAVGAILFVFTTGATVTFGLYRVHELQLRDMKESERIAEVEDLGLTEIYFTQPVGDEVRPGSPIQR